MVILDDTYISIAENKFNDDYSNMYNTVHLIYGTDNKEGVVGFEILDHVIWVTFLWSDKSFTTNKQLIELMGDVYEIYTIGKNMPILYTGEKNMYPNASKEIAIDMWQYVPKKYLNVL